ncbi:uncharacterized protein EI90DRAFT_3014710 [Cantharellus anzutake]|uniref:uncharacterized protein n=1 Tax=Cantharellus anzutake TaxID=1750568 RepID=UPI001906AFB5|nr:uncharacterized protein EI90DRAFT_3014710 [Cantharellus anzutake]KAF8335488.1 hypothetical protein EI90DRAFT_3014710 [Cantharellus anzutake]
MATYYIQSSELISFSLSSCVRLRLSNNYSVSSEWKVDSVPNYIFWKLFKWAIHQCKSQIICFGSYSGGLSIGVKCVETVGNSPDTPLDSGQHCAQTSQIIYILEAIQQGLSNYVKCG